MTTQNENIEDLSTITCKRGHVGDRYIRKDGSNACRVCLKYAQIKFRETHKAEGSTSVAIKVNKINRLLTYGPSELAHLETQIRSMLADLEDAKKLISEISMPDYELAEAKVIIAKANKARQALKLLDGLE